jgi:hypothetical protein
VRWLFCFERTDVPPSPERAGQIILEADDMTAALANAIATLDSGGEPYEIVIAGRADRMLDPSSETLQ